MARPPEEYTKTLREKLRTFDKPGAAAIGEELIAFLYATDEPFPAQEGERILQLLRNKRMFILMQQVGDALIQTGWHTFKIRRQYAQSLIDQGYLTAALAVLEDLVTDTRNAPVENRQASSENIEARGLIGRVYKQLYINANNSRNPSNHRFLQQSILSYLDVYTSAPKTHLWHGINVAALLWRGVHDEITWPGLPQATQVASDVLTVIDSKDNDEIAYWDNATAMEACLALEKADKALRWAAQYVNDPRVDAFDLASTLRQLTEVWKLDMDSPIGLQLLPILRAALLNKEGGNVMVEPQTILQQKKEEPTARAAYEKVFGNESFRPYKWYMTGADRCMAVARIGRDPSVGHGTGFLVKGSVLHETLGEEPVLITNAHVISTNFPGALRPEEAVIIFEVLNRDVEFRVGSIFWSSPPKDLDVTIIRFAPKELKALQDLISTVTLYPVARALPLIEPDQSQHVYIIGHPKGGTLQLSLQDNLLLDHQAPRLHYRTPTEGGSSGSPVFNQQWELIGLHHAGSETMPRLNGQPGDYQANEGIWVQSIIEALVADVFLKQK